MRLSDLGQAHDPQTVVPQTTKTALRWAAAISMPPGQNNMEFTEYGNSLMGIGAFTAMMTAASSTDRTVGSSTGRRKAKARPSVGEADEMRHRLDVFLSRAGDPGRSVYERTGAYSKARNLERRRTSEHQLEDLATGSNLGERLPGEELVLGSQEGKRPASGRQVFIGLGVDNI